MQLYIHRDDEQLGPYDLDHVRSLLTAGTLHHTDLAWHDGAVDWVSLDSIPEISARPATASVKPPGTPPPPLPASEPARTPIIANVSLILGFLSFITMGVAGLPAVILGHISLSQIKKGGGRIPGIGVAIGGLVTGYLGMILTVVGIVTLASHAKRAVVSVFHDQEQSTQCLNQAKQIVLGCKLYALDHDGNFPPVLDDLVPKYLPDTHLFKCPLAKDQAAMGYDYFGGKISDPDVKVLLSSKGTTSEHKKVVITTNGAGTVKSD